MSNLLQLQASDPTLIVRSSPRATLVRGFLLLSKIIESYGEDNFDDSNKPAERRVPQTRSEAEACAADREAGRFL